MSRTPSERVQIARRIDRPTSQFYIENLFTDFIELHGDRHFADDLAIIGGIGMFNGVPVTIIAEEKGVDVSERVKRNFGSPHPEGYRKALRLMQQAEKFGRPIICFVDTQGAYCGTGAEERGQGEAIAENLKQMSTMQVPIISVVVGEGGSGGALAIAVANKVAMLENAVYSILTPEGFAAILWKDSSRSEEAADIMKMTAQDLLKMKIIDKIIEEPGEGAHTDNMIAANNVKEYLLSALEECRSVSPHAFAVQRLKRFRKF